MARRALHAENTIQRPTPRMYLRGPDLHLQCDDCLHGAYADMAALVAAGRGDVPLRELRFRCGACDSRKVSALVTGVGPVIHVPGMLARLTQECL